MTPSIDMQACAARANSVLGWIEQGMRTTPDAIAVEYGSAQMRYAELDRFSRQIAAALRPAPEAHVGVLMHRCLELPAVLLGVMRAGGSYVPIDPDFPIGRIRSMVHDARIGTIIAGSDTALDLDTSLVRSVDDLCRQTVDEWVPPIVHAEQLAYTIYTSGSTGRPKGAMNTHRGLLNRLLWMQRAYGIGPGSRILQKTPFAFDVSVWEFFWPIMFGATVVVAPPGCHRDFQALGRLIADAGITHLHFVPSMLEAFLQVQGEARYPELQRIFCSGEALPTPVAEAVLKRYPHVALENLYGPTEAAIDVSHHACAAGEPTPAQPIGVAISKTRLSVLDPELRAVQPGRAGELFIQGVSLARGYAGRPGMTAERFIPAPEGHGERMYRTGDLVSERADGVIDFLGRNDFQVKVNGQRIELGDIENHLRAHPDVAMAHVMAREGPAQRTALVGYLCLSEQAALRRQVVQDHVDAWSEMYESAYQDLGHAGQNAAENFLTWNSSYDGLPLPLEAMRAWADEAASRILACTPRRVLEIGCGSGIIAQRILPAVMHYRGVDPSAKALQYLDATLRPEDREKTQVQPAFAHQVVGLLDDIDLVVLNSVIQYFPDATYLAAVLDQCLSTGTVKTIFIGDVRDLCTLDAFLVSIECSLHPDLDPETLRQRVAQRRELETELLLAPRWFMQWAERSGAGVSVSILPKQFGFDNELSRYRYDVVVHRSVAPKVEEGACDADAILTPGHRAQADEEPLESRLGIDHPGRTGTRPLPASPTAAWSPSNSVYNPVVEPSANLPLRRALTQAANSSLKAYLKERLPAYMVPERLVVLEHMPVNSSGKVDRAALPSPWRLFQGACASPPEDPLARQIHDIWAELLSAPVVPLDCSLVELGGDSITVAQMAMQCAQCGLPVTLALVQAHPTIASLAAALRDLRDDTGEPVYAVPHRASYTPAECDRLRRTLGDAAMIESINPLRPWLAGMAYETLRAPRRGLNLELVEMQFEGLDIEAFGAAWRQMMADYEWLRTAVSFLYADRPARMVLADPPLPLEVLDWRGRSIEQQESDWRALRESAWATGLPMDRAPMFRLTVVRRDEQVWWVSWLLHHVITDGWTYEVLLAELRRHYESFRHGCTARSKSLRTDAEDFEQWLTQRQCDPSVRAYWQQYLAGLPPHAGQLPRTRMQPGAAIAVRAFELAARDSQRLDQACRQAGLTLNDLLLSLAGDRLCQAFDREEWCLGAMYTLRHPDAPGAADLAGPLLTALPIRVRRIATGQSLLSAAATARQERAGHAAHAVVSDQALRSLAGLGGTQALFDVAVVFENIPAVETGQWLRRIRFDSRTGRSLVWMAWPGERLRIEAYADPSVLDPEVAWDLTRLLLADMRAVAFGADKRCEPVTQRRTDDEVVLEFSID
ncbi:hypothetical protein ASG87_16835 [Frateuria sp. Soil773]|uniref:non-ribosomal peptide synthetase n=1 Tax=Frateuria sp. Soil773 TaxID=1736407 RepID=UPI0006FB4A9D|nr:non-ribosomal peptide synthetase [Frateuria sp. Soil773]KRE95923.1 hypothetical protein ASG87_16835 [Frateuria sp. Soil773]